MGRASDALTGWVRAEVPIQVPGDGVTLSTGTSLHCVSKHQERDVGMQDTDLAHLWSQVQGRNGPGVGIDLDVEGSCAGVIQTHLSISIPCCHDPLPQLHRGAWDPARVMFNFDFTRPQHTP